MIQPYDLDVLDILLLILVLIELITIIVGIINDHKKDYEDDLDETIE